MISTAVKEEQITLESGTGTLYAVLHEPSSGPVGAALFCNPLFEERKSAYRTMVECARRLSESGFFALRFDYRGCGDSSGEFEEFSVADWLADIRVCMGFLRERSAGLALGLLGLRYGAALAVQAVSEGQRADFLVMWEPVLNGRAYIEQELRRKLVKQMLTFGGSRDARGALLKQLGDGGRIDLDGYVLTARLYVDLCGFDLRALAAAAPLRTLVVQIGPRPSVSAAVADFCAAARERCAASDCGALKGPPFWNLIGYADCSELIELTVRWLKNANRREKELFDARLGGR